MCRNTCAWKHLYIQKLFEKAIKRNDQFGQTLRKRAFHLICFVFMRSWMTENQKISVHLKWRYTLSLVDPLPFYWETLQLSDRQTLKTAQIAWIKARSLFICILFSLVVQCLNIRMFCCWCSISCRLAGQLRTATFEGHTSRE